MSEARRRAALPAPAHYERGGPTLLAQEPALARRGNPRPLAGWPDMATHLETRLAGMRSWRNSWWEHWALIARYVLPRRYHFIITANTMNRGFAINQEIADSTGTLAMRVCAAGLMSGLTSPNRRWFRLRPAIPNFQLDRAGKLWFEEVEERLRFVQAESNFYDSLAVSYEDLVTFGTAVVIDYEDAEDILRCYNPCAGEYFLAAGFTGADETFYREFTQTTAQIVEMFGLENCGRDIQALWETKGGSLEQERIVAHAIEPNFPVRGRDGGQVAILSGEWEYREVYWLRGAAGERPLSLRGFHERPHNASRWSAVSNDAYGHSPAMDALPDIMQLQLETRRKAEAIEKQVRPPLLADVSMRNQPPSTTPGAITYVPTVGPGQGMRPVFEVQPNLAAMVEDIKEIQGRIRSAFFNDVFMMISQLDTVRTATEIDARREEKLTQLGPVVERLQNECLSPRIRRQLAVMARKGLLPGAPPSLHGVPVQIEYVSMLAMAQRAAETMAIERTFAFAQNVAAIRPEIMDNFDVDETIRLYGDDLSTPTRIFLDRQRMAQTRRQRSQQQQAQAGAQAAFAATAGAKNLGQANVGEGSALGALVGQPQGNA